MLGGHNSKGLRTTDLGYSTVHSKWYLCIQPARQHLNHTFPVYASQIVISYYGKQQEEILFCLVPLIQLSHTSSSCKMFMKVPLLRTMHTFKSFILPKNPE